MHHFFSSLPNILFLDIETVSGQESYTDLSKRMSQAWDHKSRLIDATRDPAQLYFERAGIYAEFGKVIAIGAGFFFTDHHSKELKFRVKCITGSDEKEVLTEFIELITQKFGNRKLLFCAHNGKEFDYPYLCRRILLNGLDLPKPLLLSGKKSWQVDHLDTLELWKFGDHKHYSSLELLCCIFDIPGSKEDMNGSQVNFIYYHDQDLPRIARYCTEDVLATAQLYLKLHNKPLIKKEHIIWC